MTPEGSAASRSVTPSGSTRDDDWGDCTPEEAVEAVKAVRKSQPASGDTCASCDRPARFVVHAVEQRHRAKVCGRHVGVALDALLAGEQSLVVEHAG